MVCDHVGGAQVVDRQKCLVDHQLLLLVVVHCACLLPRTDLDESLEVVHDPWISEACSRVVESHHL